MSKLIFLTANVNILTSNIDIPHINIFPFPASGGIYGVQDLVSEAIAKLNDENENDDGGWIHSDVYSMTSKLSPGEKSDYSSVNYNIENDIEIDNDTESDIENLKFESEESGMISNNSTHCSILSPSPPIVHTYTTNSIFPLSTIPINEIPDIADLELDKILKLLEPTTAQFEFRYSVVAFLTRIVKQAMAVNSFECDLHALNSFSFLPDDSVRLSVLLRPSNPYLLSWVTALSERFVCLSEFCNPHKNKNNPDQSFEVNETLYMSVMTLGEDENVQVDEIPLYKHNIDNISAININNQNVNSPILSQNSIFCTVDTLPVEIVSNNLVDFHLLYFFEEISTLVGKNDLFKKSLLLIRAWWEYETKEYLSESLPKSSKNCLTNSAIAVLVCGVFNQHHNVIFHPLQALIIFLAEYSELNWSEYAVTIQGVVPFKSKIINTTPNSPKPEVRTVRTEHNAVK